MGDGDKQAEAVGLLQQLGLKEYEAKCFIALTRKPTATAKEISDIADVPRTRVYDAIRILEAQGLVEIQHTNPQQYRAVPLEEAIQTFRRQYESRIENLQAAIDAIEPAETNDEPVTHEVWSLSSTDAITNRTHKLLEDAESEVVYVISAESLVTDELVKTLDEVAATDVDVLLGTVTAEIRDQLRERVPDAEVFLSELEWLHPNDGDKVAIGRMLLIDQSTILLSSVYEATGEEKAIFGRGFQNGLVVITRRLMASGLVPVRDPTQ
ncbi:TrmB family transcriptional regulator [Halorussus aquaticus]|uniref:TrmB family transcriptional regulator n=1 Tax=Halorussus aquaticus TaxID=2953748 RepID=A0ABD5Q9F8_9EURY|nr:helix-turn-helix domain-containing protein [Halorussus aquaticus]